MSKIININTPIDEEIVTSLKAGDEVYISGIIYTGRDAAHKRMCEMLERGEELPFDIKNQIIYYVGPCPAKDGMVIGSCGPTTSGRMDAYAPTLLSLGLKGMIGKGTRNQEVIEAIKKNRGIYFGAIGGAAALIAKSVIAEEIIAFEDLGTEAIRKIEVKDFPTVVVIDSEGNDLYQIGRKKYKTGG